MPAKGTNMMPKPSKRALKDQGVVVPKSIPKYKSGQHTMKSGYCMAMHLNGKPCIEKQAEAYVPYCRKCMKTGDPSMAVEDHPRFGKCLVAKRDLPKNYYASLWGEVQTAEEMPDVDTEWGFESDNPHWNVNPRPPLRDGYMPQIQFSQCPGPNEKVTVSFGQPHSWMEPLKDENAKRKCKYGSFTFVTSCAVPKNHQLMMMYAEDEASTEKFFEERGIKRCDIGFKGRPALLKKKRGSKTSSKTVKKTHTKQAAAAKKTKNK